MNTSSRLVARIAAGNPEACAAFLDSFGPRIHRLARRHARDEADAEDLTSEIFLDLFRCVGTFRGDSQLSTWVYRVALNHCLRHREKSQKHHAESFDEVRHETGDSRCDPARHAVRRELSDQVQLALDGLSPLHRDVVILHELQNLTYRECAAVLGVPVGTVKSRLSNAFRALRGSLGLYVLGETVATDAIAAPCEIAGESL